MIRRIKPTWPTRRACCRVYFEATIRRIRNRLESMLPAEVTCISPFAEKVEKRDGPVSRTPFAQMFGQTSTRTTNQES